MKEREFAAGRAASVPGPTSGRPQEDQNRADGRRGIVRSAISRQAAAAATVSGLGPGPQGATADMYRNFGDGFSRAFELAVTPVIFGAMGYGLDRWLGIVPVLTMILTLTALIALLLRTWYGYVYRMQTLEQAGPWARRP